MESRSKIRAQSKAPTRRRPSFPQKWVARAGTMAMTGVALSLEAAVLLPDQARAATLWEPRGYELSSSLQVPAYFSLVFDDIKVRIPGEFVEGHSTIPRSHGAKSINGLAFVRPIFINTSIVALANSINTGESLFEDDSSIPNRDYIPLLNPEEAGRTGVGLDTHLGDLGSRMVDPVDFASLALEGEVSPLFGFGVPPPGQDQFFATGLKIQTNGRVLVRGERSKGHESAHEDDNNAHALARGVAPTEPQATPYIPVLHGYYYLSGTEVSLGSGIENTAYEVGDGGMSMTISTVPFIPVPFAELYEAGARVSYEIGADTIALAGSLIPFAQMSTGTLPEMMNDADPPERAGGFTLDVSATAGFETNPFLIDLPETGTASLRLSLSPTFSRQGARGDVRVSARIEQIEYTGAYDDVQNVGANFESRFMLNERLEGNVDLSFDSGVFVTNLTGLSTIVGAPNVLPGGNDISLLGLDQRRTQYQAGAGLRHQLSQRDELDVSLSFRADRFGGQDLQDLQESDFLTGRISYARQVSSALTTGVAVDASSIVFVEQSLGGITTISPQLIVGLAFSPRWELTGSLGVARIRAETDFSEETSTAFSGDVSICRNGVRANLCLTGARQVVPFGIGGAGLQSNVGASYSLRLSEREMFLMSTNYGKASETFLTQGGRIETISGLISYQLELAERVRLSADARYTNLKLDVGPIISNFQALVSLTLNMGRTQ
jgi:hypothetical protein